MSLVGAAAIGALGGLASNWFSGRQQNRNVNKTNRANRQMAEYSFDRNKDMAEYSFNKQLEMWKLQNKYNSPEQQMQRFEDAGLSKHMIYGQGSPGNATGTPQYNAPTFNSPTQDFTGRKSISGDTLQSITGASRDYLELKQANETLKQQEIDTWLKNETKYYKASQASSESWKSNWDAQASEWRSKIERIKKNFWEKGISPSDATWLRIGLNAIEQLNAPPWVKKIFQGIPQQLKNAIK